MEFFVIPEALQREHEALREQLADATRQGGKTGEAAKAVAALLRPHLEKEEDFALPPLGLLPHLVAGRISPVMRSVTVMADRLRADLEQMLAEHEAIVAAVDRLKDAARDEDQMRYAHLAERLIPYALTEEQLIYPTAIMIGKYIKLKLGE